MSIETERQLDDLERTFDLIHEADMRAIKIWRKAGKGRELIMPDRAKMVIWLLEQLDKPIPMILYCPNCGCQHVDKPEPERGWENPPHRSHLCAECGWIWRPADVATVGVQLITTVSTKDSPVLLRARHKRKPFAFPPGERRPK